MKPGRMSWLSPVAGLAVLCCGLVAGSAASAASEHALVIGINKYAAKRGLFGAVNDAKDLATVFREKGIADVTMLTDEMATRDAVEKAWADMAARATPGDTLILTFAGHGMSEPEKGAVRLTQDGYDKGFALQPFAEAQHPEEILRWEHLYDLFKAQADRGLKVLFISDACHAGAGIRGVPDARAKEPAIRFETYDTEAAAAPVVPDSSFKPRPPIPGVAVFSATDERLTVAEITIDSQQRGALSWAIARTLESDLVARNGGALTAGVLQNAIVPLVREKAASAKQQIPQFNFLDANQILFDFRANVPPAPALQDASAAPLPDLRDVALAFADAAPAGDARISGARMVADKASVAILWDQARKQLLNGTGDIIASGVDDQSIVAAVQSKQVTDALIATMAKTGSPLPVRLRALDGGTAAPTGFFLKGQNVSFELDKPDTPYVTVFDLNADGTVQFQWPIEKLGDLIAAPTDKPLTFQAPVSAPFGFDTLVFVTTAVPLPDLHRQLYALHGKADPIGLYNALQTALAGKPFRLGIQSEFTCERLKDNGQCNTNISPKP